jgi:anti-anti-sigma regulatory factor
MRACRRQVFKMVMMEQPGLSLLDEDSRIIVKIEGNARVETAMLLKQSLAQTPMAREVAIDWSEAEHVDASVLQVLLALRKSLSEHSLPFTVDRDNLKVREYLKLSGLSEYFPVRDRPPEAARAESPNA